MAAPTRKGSKRKPAKQAGFEVTRDSVTVTVSFSPVCIKELWYPSWLVDYYHHGRRVRERAKNRRAAKALADAVASKLAQGQMEALELRGADRRVYLAFRSHLKRFKQPLDAIAREYADAKRMANNEDLRTVAAFFKKFARTKLKPITVPELVKVMTKTLEQDKRGDYHIRDLEVRLGRFAKDFPGQIRDVTTEQIENWLRSLTSLAKGSRRGTVLKGRSRNNYRNAIVELFNFGRKHGYLPKDLSTEASSANRVQEDDKRNNEIFLPKQLKDLLNNVPAKLIPGMAVKAFSGVRTEEVAAMEWQHILFKRGYIILPKEITKKRRRRITPLMPNLQKWLKPFEGLKGRICPDWSTPQAVFQAWEKRASKLGIKAGANRFRNSYISYRVAETSDPEKVALETGNSAAVIMEDYLELTTPEEAAQWFKIGPSPEKVAELEAYARRLVLGQKES